MSPRLLKSKIILYREKKDPSLGGGSKNEEERMKKQKRITLYINRKINGCYCPLQLL